jgi:hypothetical protein
MRMILGFDSNAFYHPEAARALAASREENEKQIPRCVARARAPPFLRQGKREKRRRATSLRDESASLGGGRETDAKASIVGSKSVCYTKIETSVKKKPQKRAKIGHLRRFRRV